MCVRDINDKCRTMTLFCAPESNNKKKLLKKKGELCLSSYSEGFLILQPNPILTLTAFLDFTFLSVKWV